MSSKDLETTGKSLVDLDKALGLLQSKFDLKNKVVEIERTWVSNEVGSVILWKVTAEV